MIRCLSGVAAFCVRRARAAAGAVAHSVPPRTAAPDFFRNAPGRGGWLEVVCGPMFSGKSEELIRRLRRAEIAGQRALIVKPRLDDRYDIAHVVSHAGARMRAVAARARAAEARVRQWMTPNPVTIEPETPIEDAAQVMFDNNFRHLPVVKDGRPLGIVSLRLLSRWAFDSVQRPE